MKSITRRAVATISAAAVAGAGAGAVVTAVAQPGSAKTVTTQVAGSGATTTANAGGGALGVDDIYTNAKQGVVEIAVTSGGGSKALGSGFVIDKSGNIVTNDHVVSGASSIQVQFADGTKANAKLVGADPSSDIAVIKVAGVDAAKLQPLSFGD